MSAEAEGAPAESLIGHLIELRSRLLKATVAVALALLALLPFANRLYAWLAAPLLARLPEGGQLVAIDVASPFFTPLKLAAVAALFVAMPAVLYQLWAFVAPGLYRHEKRLARPLLVAAVLLFYAGCSFAYFLVLPAVFGFIAAFAPEGVAVMPDIARYLDFVLALSLVFGVCFEVPVAVVVMVLLRWVTVPQLREARGYVIVGIFVIAAIVTPPDVLSQLMLAIPMCLLYEAGIVAAALLSRPAKAAG
jgi:sec-independent protein translocase protein TatC